MSHQAPSAGAPSQPPGKPPPSPPTGGGQPVANRLSKNATIAITVGAVLVLALVGVLLGNVLKGDASAQFDQGGLGGPGEPTPAPGPESPQETPSPSGTLQPSPVATNAPPPPPSPAPQPTPTQPVPGPTAGPQPGGQAIELANGAVIIPVPAGWEAQADEGGTAANLLNQSLASIIAVQIGTFDPSVSASQIMAQSGQQILGPSTQLGEIQALQPQGAMTSFAQAAIQATLTDNQASMEVGGVWLVANRQDGLAISLVLLGTPPASFNPENFGAVVNPALASYAGTG